MKTLTRAILTAALCVLVGRNAAAQTPKPITEFSLEELLNVRVVTVTRTIEGASQAPAAVEVVTAEQIRRRGYRSLADLLRDLPGIKVDFAIDQDLSADVTVQGTRGAMRLVILLDGVRISAPTAEPLPILANYPVHSAQQIELVYGPASALYGADAFSGVINIITRDAAEAQGLQAATTVGQWGLTDTTASYGAVIGRARLMVSGQFFYDGQPDLSRYYPEAFGNMASHRTGVFNTIFGPMTSAVPVSADYDVPVRANSVHAALTAGRLQASLFSSSVRTSNTPAYTPDNAVYNDIAFALNRLLVGSIAYTANIGRARTTTTLSGSRHELDPNSGYLNVYSNLQRSYKYAYGSRVRAEHQATWSATPDLRLTAGGEYERMFSIPQTADLNAPLVDHNTPGTILGTTIVDELYRVRYSNLAGYVQAQWDAHPRARLTGGLRADYNSRYDAVVNPRVGLVSRLTQSTTGKLLYGSAYLAPSPYQSFLHYGGFYSTDDGATYQSDFWHVPNPDLKPQRKRTFEAQVQQALGRNLNVGLSAFYSRFTDLVFESDVTSRESGRYLGWPVAFIQQSINGGREATYGGTLSVEYLNVFEPRRQLRVRGALSHADGRVDEATAPGGRIESGAIAPLMLQATLDLDWDQWSVAPRLIAVSQQRALALDMANDGPWRRRTIDGYATVDVTVRRTDVGPLDLFVRVDNLFDARYRNVNLRAFTNPEEMEGSPQNPRRLSAGVQIRLK